jgi:hypothetical protein
MLRDGLLFTTLGLASLLFPMLTGGWTWVFSWVGANFIGVGVACGARLPGVFGKRRDGSMRKLNVIVRSAGDLLERVAIIGDVPHSLRTRAWSNRHDCGLPAAKKTVRRNF